MSSLSTNTTDVSSYCGLAQQFEAFTSTFDGASESQSDVYCPLKTSSFGIHHQNVWHSKQPSQNGQTLVAWYRLKSPALFVWKQYGALSRGLGLWHFGSSDSTTDIADSCNAAHVTESPTSNFTLLCKKDCFVGKSYGQTGQGSSQPSRLISFSACRSLF